MTMRTALPLVTFRRLTSCAFIVTAPLVIGAIGAIAAPGAIAQTAPPADAPAAMQEADPPGRVARLNYMAGTVTTEPAGATDWSYASINRPLTTGDQLWNDANARSELHIGSTALRLGSSTNLDILNLDDANTQLKVTQGTLSTHVRELAPGSSYEIDTPNVALAVTRPGDYRVDVSPDGSTTTVTVRRGALTAYGDNDQMPLSAGDQITFSGTSLQETASQEGLPPDAFDEWAVARDEAEDRSISARYVSREVPGYEDLDENGTWRTDPQYGAVWVPSAVPVGWAPYHYGHWAWIAPWGWTWVDDAPWGFAPYHYGRWAYVGSSWCWAPGPIVAAPPVYAPALVAFIGDGGGGASWSVGLTIGGALAPGVAWFPLGPGEIWRPHYGHWTPRYFERVNRTVIANHNVNITNIHNTYVNYRAPGGVTAVPATAFVQGRPVEHFAQRVDPRQWRGAQITPGAPGVAPVRESYAPGLRHATYRPPQSMATRQVVATRAPAVPSAYRDPLAQHLAQSGAHVPGAGRPVEQLPALAGIAAQLAHPKFDVGAARNVRIVSRASPTLMQAHGPAPTAERPAPGVEPRAPQAPMGHPPSNGVPRPPAENALSAGGPIHHEPVWTQPHVQGQPRMEARPQPQPHAEAPPQVHVEPRTQPQRQAQPRVEVRQPPQPHFEAPPQPRFEPRPQPQPHFEAPPQPHFEPHPQPQFQPQPRMEARMQPPPPQPHVQQQPQPREQPHEQPHAQPQGRNGHPQG
jgi:hypothetical protein